MTSPRSQIPRPPRASLIFEIHYRNAGQFLVSYCTNLSRGGLFVRTNEPYPVDTLFPLCIKVPGLDEATTLEAHVRWIRSEADEQGPPGMGISFHQVEEVLGEVIDQIITTAVPLHIDLIGPHDLGSRHLAALVQSLVSCQVSHHEPSLELIDQLRPSDLVIIDLDADKEKAMRLLEALTGLEPCPPTLALCNARDTETHRQASSMSRVVATPVDSSEFQTSVLETLCHVQTIIVEAEIPEDSSSGM